jgi:hypothetical protein
VRFVLITDKTVNQCMKALTERMQQSETKSRPAIDGWVEKGGRFSISVSQPVIGKVGRRTKLRATASRESGTTVIRGFVPNGIDRGPLILVGVFVALLAGYMFVQGQLLYAIIIAVAGGGTMIPLWGDHQNHDRLLYELERTLKAKPAPRDFKPTKSTRRKK